MENKQEKNPSTSLHVSALPIGEDAMNHLLQMSTQLWRETSFEKLIQRFVEQLHDLVSLRGVGIFFIKGVQAPFALDRIEFDFSGNDLIISVLNEDEIVSLADALKSINLKTADLRQGYSRLVCGDRNYFFALLGDPAVEWRMLVWRTEGRLPVNPVQEFCSDFLTRQMQSTCVWFQRLDKTQSLLYRDDLTGVFNNRYLDIAIASEVRRSQRFQTSFCLLFIDLDNFKSVNDLYGHMSGSAVLKQLADVLREASREVDSVIRFGGDEFVILLLGATPSTGVLAAERIRRRIESTAFRLDQGQTVRLTASLGVAAFPDHAKDADALIKLADEMMYKSKKQGKNRVNLYRATVDIPTTELDSKGS